MSKFNLIEKLNLISITIHQKTEIASGKDSKGVLVSSSSLDTKATDFSKSPKQSTINKNQLNKQKK